MSSRRYRLEELNILTFYYVNKVTELENRPFCNQPITACIEDFSCLSLPCDNSIITVKDWMLAVQAKICETL